MKILHGSWIPGSADDFIQTGGFYLWVEVAQLVNPSQKTRATRADDRHLGQLGLPELKSFLENFVELEGHRPLRRYFALPTAHNQPLPAPELARYLEIELPDRYDELRHWAVDCYEVTELGATDWLDRPFPIIAFLHELHLLALESSHEFQLGTDLQFWYHYSQSFKAVIYKDQYIPSLKYRKLGPPAKKTKAKKTEAPQSEFEIYATWEIISQQYEDNLQRYIQHMPLLCAAGAETFDRSAQLHDPLTLLRHFSECLLNNLLLHTPSTGKFDKQIANTLIQTARTVPGRPPAIRRLQPSGYQPSNPQQGAAALAQYQQWLPWKKRLTRSQEESSFDLCFQLHSAAPEQPDRWQMEFWAIDKQSSSLRTSLGDYWRLSAAKKANFQKKFGKDFETLLLINLGHAARIYPKIWQGLEGDRPSGLELTLEEAFGFLQESAWVLEDAGFKVMLPAWYTPAGRRRAKIKLKGSSLGKKSAPQVAVILAWANSSIISMSWRSAMKLFLLPSGNSWSRLPRPWCSFAVNGWS